MIKQQKRRMSTSLEKKHIMKTMIRTRMSAIHAVMKRRMRKCECTKALFAIILYI